MTDESGDRDAGRVQVCATEPTLGVAHISPSTGGVANAAKALHVGLLKRGVNSSLFVGEVRDPDAPRQRVYRYPSSSSLLRYADRVARYIDRRFGLTGMIHVSSLFWSFPHYNVLHLHGVDSSWFNLHVLRRLGHTHVLVWTMHDKHLGTGACGYPEFWGGCERWRIGCGQCPKAHKEGWLLDCTRFVYARKRSMLARTPLAIVAPSQWMFDFVASNPLTNTHLLRHIPNGVDTTVFAPLPPAQSRHELGLPTTETLLLSVASELGQPRKGLQYYQPLLAHLKNECNSMSLILVGNPPPENILAKLRGILPVHALGLIGEPATLAKIYSAADLFLTTPMIDNFPSVLLESLACGTPVAAFRVGGIPDVVIPDRTGVLAELGDIATLAAEIGDLFRDPAKITRMRTSCRQLVAHKYSLDAQATQCVELYKELLGARHQAPSSIGRA